MPAMRSSTLVVKFPAALTVLSVNCGKAKCIAAPKTRATTSNASNTLR